MLQFLPGDGVDGRRPRRGRSARGRRGVHGLDGNRARDHHRTLAGRGGPIPTLIAETGGQNAMIVDSSALPEQVVLDAVQSAFNSAGQRCSALRVLCVQEEIAEKVMRLLAGAMDELVIGDPALLRDRRRPGDRRRARVRSLEGHARADRAQGALASPLPARRPTRGEATFVAPLAVEIDSIGRARARSGSARSCTSYCVTARDRLEPLVDAINATGYGLTFGIHSRIDSTVRTGRRACRAGNVYVNRNMIGAVVGRSPSAAAGSRARGPRPAARITCTGSPTSAR